MSTHSDEYIGITLWLAERSYPIRVKRSEEEVVRMAVKIANERIDELRLHYQGDDDQDFIAMALLMYATDQVTEPDAVNPVVREKIEIMKKKIMDTIS